MALLPFSPHSPQRTCVHARTIFRLCPPVLGVLLLSLPSLAHSKCPRIPVTIFKSLSVATFHGPVIKVMADPKLSYDKITLSSETICVWIIHWFCFLSKCLGLNLHQMRLNSGCSVLRKLMGEASYKGNQSSRETEDSLSEVVHVILWSVITNLEERWKLSIGQVTNWKVSWS